MKAVITGDISGFTKVTAEDREDLVHTSRQEFENWFPNRGLVEFFRGDSFQMLFDDPERALWKAIQVRCWYKKWQGKAGSSELDSRLAIGIGEISYFGDTVLDADGEAFHLSGRTFDKMGSEKLRIITPDKKLNRCLDVITDLMDVIISGWTLAQAEVVYLLLNEQTQQQMAAALNIAQSAVNNRLKLAKWKEIEKSIRYIATTINELS